MNSSKEILGILVMMIISGLAGFAFYSLVIAPRTQVNFIQTSSRTAPEAVNIEKLNAVEKTTDADRSLSSLTVKDMQANPVSLDKWQENLLVINFWATWCPPCRKEIPLLIETQKKYSQDNVQFLGIAMDDANDVSRYMQTIDFNYPVLISDMNETIRIGQAFDYNFIALPFTLFVSADGKSSRAHTGELTTQELNRLIEELSAPALN